MNLSLEYLEHFFHGNPAGIALITSRIIVFSSSQMADITGYPKKELVGKHAGLFYPNDRESKRVEKVFYPSLRKKGMATIETKWRNKAGETISVFLGGILLDYKINLEKSDSEQESILIMVFDISGRKSLESTLRENQITLQEALESTGDAFWDWNIDSGNVHFNDEWVKMLGYKRKDIEFHIRTWQKLIHQDDWHHVRKALNDHLWGDAESYAAEYRLKSKLGSWVWIFDYGKVTYRDEKGYPLQFIGTSTEITSLKKIEQKNFLTENQISEDSFSESPFLQKIFKKKTLPAKGMEVFSQLLQNPYVSDEQRNYYLQLMFNSENHIPEAVHNIMNIYSYDKTVLIVEDDRSNAFFLDEVLRSSEFKRLNVNTQIATNGRDAVKFCKNNPVDLVLMDIKLPFMDGLTACRNIKLLKPQLPIIAQTACASPADKEKVLAAGCNDYLVKPISVSLILQKLKKYLLIRKRTGVFNEN